MDVTSNPFAPRTESSDVAHVAKPCRQESQERSVMQYESTLKGLRNAVEVGNSQEAQRLMEHALAAYVQVANIPAKTQDASLEWQLQISKSFRSVPIAARLGALAPPELASDKRPDQEASLEDGLLRSRRSENDGMQVQFPGVKRVAQQSFNPFPKYNTRSRYVNVLKLRGGGEGDQISPGGTNYGTLAGENDPRVQLSPSTKFMQDEQIKAASLSGAIPIIKPTLAQKMFIMFDDDYISIGLVLGDCGCSFASMIVKWGWLTMLSDIILWVMVFQQVLEIVMNSSLAKYQRMLADGDRIQIIERVHTLTFHTDHGGMEKPRGGAYLLPGSTGNVFVIRPRRSAVQDEGAFIRIDGIEKELYFVPWTEYRHLQIMSGLGDYMSNPVNIFNIALLLSVIIMPYIDKGAKGVAFLILILRIVKPVLKIYSRKLKLQEAGEKTGLTEEAEEEEEEEEEGHHEGGEHGEGHHEEGEHGEGKEGEGAHGGENGGRKSRASTKREEPRLCC